MAISRKGRRNSSKCASTQKSLKRTINSIISEAYRYSHVRAQEQASNHTVFAKKSARERETEGKNLKVHGIGLKVVTHLDCVPELTN